MIFFNCHIGTLIFEIEIEIEVFEILRYYHITGI